MGDKEIGCPGKDQDPAPDHQIFFLQQTCEILQKKIARNILWMLFTLISDLKIIQQAVKLPRRASHDNSISFSPKL
jgi:hypothetical protein